MPAPNPFYSSPLLGMAVTLGNLAIWLGLTFAVLCVTFYATAMLRAVRQAKLAAAAEEPANGNGKTNGKKNGKHRAGAGLAATSEERKTDRIGLWGRRFFYATGACVVIGSLCLWALIFAQQYSVQYVWKNTNQHLPFGYRFASFWSDQEGTFFLWGLYNTILGSLLIWKARQDERWVMPFFGLVNISLFTLLTFMNPFWLQAAQGIREALERDAPKDLLPTLLSNLPHDLGGHIAYYFGWAKYIDPKLINARGLNESLQNPWMVIHPPTLFVGYASMMVPACFALGALMRRDYDSWVTRAVPWLAFSWTVLGFGIFLGGYWAYETLGWGGYWAWDPVENSSLLPWVVGTALLHGLLAQRNRGNYKQANLFLGIMAGGFVLIGSFLVRSGVLSENSVHSFATPQKSVFFTLLAAMIIWMVLGIGIWLWRFKDIQAEIAYENVWERHFGFFLGLIVLSATALVITFGVTAPIWVPKLTTDHTFYNKALMPVAFVMVLLLTLTPLMPWRQVRERPLNTFNKVVLGLAALVTVAFIGAAVNAWRGGFRAHNVDPPSYVNDPVYIAFACAVGLGLLTNCVVLARAARGGILNTGAWLAHIGFLVMLGGIVWTTRFKTIQTFEKVAVNETVSTRGIQFTYLGREEVNNPLDRDRIKIQMKEPNGKETLLRPKIFISSQTGDPMAWPQILHRGLDDLYVEPKGFDTFNVVTAENVKQGEEKGLQVQRTRQDTPDLVLLRFNQLDTSELQTALQKNDGRPMRIYADVTLNVNGVEQKLRPAVELGMSAQGGLSHNPIPLRIQGLNQGVPYDLLFDTNMQPGNLTATFTLKPLTAVPQGHFEVLYVPGIQVLWWGCYTMFLGGFIVWLRRRKLAKAGPAGLAPKPEPEPAPEPVEEKPAPELQPV